MTRWKGSPVRCRSRDLQRSHQIGGVRRPLPPSVHVLPVEVGVGVSGGRGRSRCSDPPPRRSPVPEEDPAFRGRAAGFPLHSRTTSTPRPPVRDITCFLRPPGPRAAQVQGDVRRPGVGQLQPGGRRSNPRWTSPAPRRCGGRRAGRRAPPAPPPAPAPWSPMARVLGSTAAKPVKSPHPPPDDGVRKEPFRSFQDPHPRPSGGWPRPHPPSSPSSAEKVMP